MLWVISSICVLAGMKAFAGNHGESWRVVAYDDAHVFVIHPDGVKLINLPEPAQHREPPGNINLKLSPDARYVVYSNKAKDSTQLGIFILDLVAGSIRAVEEISVWRSPEEGLGDIVMVGPFSPDGQLVAVSMADWYGGILQIVEVASGEVLIEASTTQLIGQKHRNYALMTEWTDEGILLYPHCFPCEGFVEGVAYRWQPDHNSITLTNIPYRVVNNQLLSDRLTGSGEVLVAGQDINAPGQASPVMDANIIAYYDLDSTQGMNEGRVIYTDSADSSLLLMPRWVADGRAYIVHSQVTAETTLVLRDGTVRSIYGSRERTIVSGTPDGWIMRDDDHFYHYVVAAAGDIEIHAIPYVEEAPIAFGFLFVSETAVLGNAASQLPYPVNLVK